MRSVEHQGSKPIEPLTLGGRLLYPQIVSAGVAHVLRLRTASRMRTFIWSLDVEEITSLKFTVLSGIAHVHCSAHAQFHFDFGRR